MINSLRWMHIILAVLAGMLGLNPTHAENRYMRYRVLAPAVPTIATIGVASHILSETSWDPIDRPGVISNYGLYLSPNTWSPWRRLPDPPTWGTIQLNLKALEPIKSSKVEFQVGSHASERDIARQFIESSETGGSVAFILPEGGILENPRGLETLSESYARRRKLAEEVAVPIGRRPRLFSFTGWGVRGQATLKGSEEYEQETARLLGINTFGQPGAGKYFYAGATDEKGIDDLKFSPAEAKSMAFLMMADEPSWMGGFNMMWERTKGNEGFRQYLKLQNLDPGLFGKKSLDEVSHIPRGNEVASDAPLEQRRLWYWSCRYTYNLDADFYAAITKKLETKYPGAQSTVNFTSHAILLGQGVGVSNPDIFAWGRRRAVTMEWSEDWFAPGLGAWGNGMYQKLAFLVELMRCAGRATNPPQRVGYFIIGSNYDPFNPFTEQTVATRLNLMLGRGAKTFGFFNYGPTSSAAVDFWSDNAPTVRGTADALQMVGAANIEPFLWEGKPGKTQACMFYSIPAAFWQGQNKALDDNNEKQLLYCMLAQEHIPADIIDTTDLSRWINDYKVAYMVDSNIPSTQGARLLAWVKAGGVLVLWPKAGAKDEYNQPADTFPAAVGATRVGLGQIVRFPERMATQWWDRVVKANETKSWRPVITDEEYRAKVAAPALQMAGLSRPVTAASPDIDVRALYSARGVAVPVVNLRYLFPQEHQTVQIVDGKEKIVYPKEREFPDGCLRYTKENPASVTLNDAVGIVRVYSSRLGALPFTRQGNSVTVSFPLNTTDILIFSKTKVEAGP